MICREIQLGSGKCTLACDAKCHKAWGINSRHRITFDEKDEDDYAFLSDGELGRAPEDPGTYEGGQAKPRTVKERLNKWCYRECERSVILERRPLPDFSQRLYNQPWKHRVCP